jgi:alkanesulfonate monooxygenase SsuD/methylene tetrahydromethanopterin reductase-like flavin-dependent oxidoreductase (luciferase family)
MKVGVHFDVHNPLEWRQNPSHVYGFTLEACQEAERLGISSAWFSEHHRSDDDKLPCPLTFAAAVAARTRHIRLGAVITAALHHPAEVAEQSAVVDLLSDGRVDLGISVGDRAAEFGLFDLPMVAPDTDTAVRRLRALWGRPGIRPCPLQDRLPIWLEYTDQRGAHRAGLLGERLLSADAALWAPYREGLAAAGHPPDSGIMGGRVQAWASEDPERDWPSVSAYVGHQLNTFRQSTATTDQTESGSADLRQKENASRSAPFESFIFGTPEFVAATIQAGTAGAPVDTVILPAAIGGMDDTTVMRNIDLICQRLVPLLAAPEAVSACPLARNH